jgi:hypothetical protein
MWANHQTGDGQDLIQLPNHSHIQSIKKFHKANKQARIIKQTKQVSDQKSMQQPPKLHIWSCNSSKTKTQTQT